MRDRDKIRAEARLFEQGLPQDQRKRLGQFFTGVPLGKVLAHLALDDDTRTVLDPLAGHGDLLDATWEAAIECGISLARLDGIEVDEQTAETCRVRLDRLKDCGSGPEQLVIEEDAFDPRTIERLPEQAYDLVITNPPYVRYQARTPDTPGADKTRENLKLIFDRRLPSVDAHIWNSLAAGYSGLADLSVPAWLLTAALVKPGGHLAMVVPATWRSRDYADVVRYLLLRCFEVMVIVEDQQPGWFCDALVRTHLVVAKRLDDDASRAVTESHGYPSIVPWLRIAPVAASSRSLVGTAFSDDTPEASFAAWTRTDRKKPITGISEGIFDPHKEWATIWHQSRRKAWFGALEANLGPRVLRNVSGCSLEGALPHAIQTMVSEGFRSCELQVLDQIGIKIGQGLRTGCNAFFYVTFHSVDTDGITVVETSDLFGNRRLSCPKDTLQSVIRRQSDIGCLDGNQTVLGRVLDLREWVLPEDAQSHNSESLEQNFFGESCRVMPDQLAAHVRLAATIPANGKCDGVLIPDLSAVRTNIRSAKGGNSKPRFWYMLPDFAPRHRPAAFVPRINQDTPWVEVNADEPVLVDANFSTFWSPEGSWSRYAIKALLNSSWSRAYMEAIGTPLGGGALKLEATHLRRMLLPKLANSVKVKLHELGQSLSRDAQEKLKDIDQLVLAPFVSTNEHNRTIQDLADDLRQLARRLSSFRQKVS